MHKNSGRTLNPQVDIPPFAATVVVAAAVLSTAIPGRPGLPLIGFNIFCLYARMVEPTYCIKKLLKRCKEMGTLKEAK